MGLYLLDYGAGNVQSLANTISRLALPFQWITCPADFAKATVSLLTPVLACLAPLTTIRVSSFLALAPSKQL